MAVRRGGALPIAVSGAVQPRQPRGESRRRPVGRPGGRELAQALLG